MKFGKDTIQCDTQRKLDALNANGASTIRGIGYGKTPGQCPGPTHRPPCNINAVHYSILSWTRARLKDPDQLIRAKSSDAFEH